MTIVFGEKQSGLFHVIIGAYDECEVCELVELLITTQGKAHVSQNFVLPIPG